MGHPRIIASLLIGLTASPAAAQTMYGRITDATNGQPISVAALTIVRLDNPDSLTVVSDSIGGYSVTVPGAGRYVLRASRLGYERASTSPFELFAGEFTRMDIKLAPVGVELAPIKVVGRSGLEPARFGFSRRCEGGTGLCLDANDIAQRNPRVVYDALRGVDGVSADWEGSQGYKLRSYNGECLMLFLNNSIYPALRTAQNGRPVGVVTGPQAHALALQMEALDPKQLLGIEVYLSYHDVPLELRESMLGFALWPPTPEYKRPCGAVIFWTRAAW